MVLFPPRELKIQERVNRYYQGYKDRLYNQLDTKTAPSVQLQYAFSFTVETMCRPAQEKDDFPSPQIPSRRRDFMSGIAGVGHRQNSEGLARPVARTWATRVVRTLVLPVPAPAAPPWRGRRRFPVPPLAGAAPRPTVPPACRPAETDRQRDRRTRQGLP